MREYFSHDFSARSDRKLVKLAMKHGMEGVGSFWCIVEMLFEEQGTIMLSECERIAFELRVDYSLIESLLNDFDLFQKDENCFWSESVNKRIESQILVSNGAKKAANTRWEKYKNQQFNANALQPQSEGTLSAMPEKKRKEKEIKEKDIPTESEFLKYYQSELAKDFPGLEFSIKTKYETWVDSGWKDGNGNTIMNWKLKLKNTIPHLKPQFGANGQKPTGPLTFSSKNMNR